MITTAHDTTGLSFSHTRTPEDSIREAGAPIQRAKAAAVLVHGRGATAESILSLADALAQPGVLYRAPQASGRVWYPHSFLAPLRANEPALTSALQTVRDVLAALAEGGIPAERTVILGFSQGACLALEFAARHPRRYGGVVAFSGGLIGNGEREGEPPDDKTFDYGGSLEGTPVFVGCSDRDPHVPLRRVEQTAEAFERLGADATTRIYEGMGHTINDDEMGVARGLLAHLTSGPP